MFTLIEKNEHFIIVCKHTGVNFHKGSASIGLTDEIRSSLGIEKIFPVHRLDTITSGLLLFALNAPVAKELSRQFTGHTLSKLYLAIGGSKPKKKQGLITGDMKKGRNGAWGLTHTKKNPAITRFHSTSLVPGLRLYILKPYTGKTHQIRVALKSLGAPVLGDPLYKSNSTSAFTPDRGYLHAYTLGFNLYGNEYTFLNVPTEGSLFTSPHFAEALKRLGNDPWETEAEETPPVFR